MPVQDFDVAPDHPCRVLTDQYNGEAVAFQPETGVEGTPDSATVQDAINVLRLFERSTGRVFATLDKKALLDVQALYDAGVNETNRSEFISAVCDLLGLD